MTLLAAIGPAWAWVIAGLLLAGGEVAAPGIFLIWLGLACVATGAVVAVAALAWPVQVLVFAGFAGAAVLLGGRLMRPVSSDLNRRGHNLVGREFVLDEGIRGGVGRLRLGDTSWRVAGLDLEAGVNVRIVRLDGVTLMVEPAADHIAASGGPSSRR